MASLVTHAVVAATVAAVYGVKPTTATPWLVGIACAVGPDLDVIGFWLGVPYDSFWGHRGFTHSIVFAVVVSWMCAWWTGGSSVISRGRLWSLYGLAMLSHGLLDALTDGGLGVAFFSPLDESRFFFPVRPIRVSSMSIRDVLGPHGLDVLVNEIQWVWVPCGLIAGIRWGWSRTRPIS